VFWRNVGYLGGKSDSDPDFPKPESFRETVGYQMKAKSEAELIKLFAKLGARDPAMWARSQLTEKIPQIARFVFLRQLWKLVVAENDNSWIQEGLTIEPTAPGGAIGSALRLTLSRGASEADLTTIVRIMQWRLLMGFCYLLDDPGVLEDDIKDITWCLFQVDEDGKPIAPITGLHESVLETEPSGREMKPRR
jgi:hypothetical protein